MYTEVEILFSCLLFVLYNARATWTLYRGLTSLSPDHLPLLVLKLRTHSTLTLYSFFFSAWALDLGSDASVLNGFLSP